VFLYLTLIASKIKNGAGRFVYMIAFFLLVVKASLALFPLSYIEYEFTL